MIKYLLFCLLLLSGFAVMAQPKKSVVNLVSSQRSQGIKRNGADVIKVYKGIFQQDYSILRSDSAYFYPQINSFDAFGHVNIQQGDTLNIYSDKLNYNGNTHIALLTDNVRMVDKDATLTTNFLTYNTATRVGTYTGGGKLVNKENVLTSTNGYYFAFSRDAYFRYNVVLTTVDALIKTDTLRYNSGSRIAYFYGPTHIYGKKNKDTLYTENGTYNTITEQAFFGKKNRYSQGTKSLKGDSLFYDRLKGYGRAVKNVVFDDNEQKITLHGDLGTYYQKEEHTVLTRNPWVTIVTEEKDTTKTDSVKKVPVTVAKKTKQTVKKAAVAIPAPPVANHTTAAPAIAPKTDTLKLTSLKDTAAKVKRDTIYWASDTLETQILTYKNLKNLVETRRLARIVDTTAAGKARRIASLKKPSKFLSISAPKMLSDTGYLHRDFFGPPKKAVPKIAKQPAKGASKKAAGEVQYKVRSGVDSVYNTQKVVLQDTARIRILFGHHNSKIFKSDFQAVADSIFYSSGDSVIRCYVKPMMWSQGSQMSGDTIYLQLKNKKLDNMDIFPKAFIVNVEKNDTAYFNQVSGKKMKGYFKDSKLSRMFVDGNAESIYFSRDSNTVTDMLRSLSSRIRVNFKDNKVQNILSLVKPDQRYGPIKKFKEDDRILKGFIWKPHDRPESKEQIIPALDKAHKYRRLVPKAALPPLKALAKGKLPPLKNTPAVKTLKDTVTTKIAKDTTLQKTIIKAITKADSLLKKAPVPVQEKVRSQVSKGLQNN